MKRDALLYVEDILESISKIEEYTRGLSETRFVEDALIQDAVIRRLEVMGEAVKNIPATVRKRYPEIRWKEIAGMRDVVIHGYFGVDARRVWKVVRDD
jgi:uncharacterized protein with HEPN domain